MLDAARFEKAKQFIFRYGRLLERKRFLHHFNGGAKEVVLQALACYQNEDGGFGHGIELDVMAPASSSVGAETAMMMLDQLDAGDSEIAERVEAWTLETQQENGQSVPAPDELTDYPHGEWWAGPMNDDPTRVLSLAAFLGKWDRGTPEFFDRVHARFADETPGSPPAFYAYPWYLCLRYAPDVPRRDERLAALRADLPAFLDEERAHYPIFLPYWAHALDEFDEETVAEQASRLIAGFQEDGGLKIPYEQLPWWRPVWTLDGLIGLDKLGLLEG